LPTAQNDLLLCSSCKVFFAKCIPRFTMTSSGSNRRVEKRHKCYEFRRAMLAEVTKESAVDQSLGSIGITRALHGYAGNAILDLSNIL